jgi:RNA polymerase sigma-70 factor (ECF subfamily)
VESKLLDAFNAGRGRAGDAPGLAEGVAAAAQHHPGVRADLAAFARRVGEVVATDGDLAKVHLPDLYLAFACVHGDEAAIRTFSHVHLPRIQEWVAHVDRSTAFADDVRQEVSRRLLVGHEGPPQIGGYSGRGALGAFVRVFATRLARKMKRRKADQADRHREEPDGGLPSPDLDPELALLRRKFAREFAEAFRTALSELGPDERNVLKLHYLDGLSIDEVGVAYRVSRATAARWLAKARGRVADETRRLVAERLGPSAPNGASLLALVQSQLDASLMKMLR